MPLYLPLCSYLTWWARSRTGLRQRLQRLRTLLPNMAGQIKDRSEQRLRTLLPNMAGQIKDRPEAEVAEVAEAADPLT